MSYCFRNSIAFAIILVLHVSTSFGQESADSVSGVTHAEVIEDKVQFSDDDINGAVTTASYSEVRDRRSREPSSHPFWLQRTTSLSSPLLDFQNRQTNKELMILEYGKQLQARRPVVVAGAQARVSFLAATTNRSSKFPYLGRFPTDFTGSSATDARLLQANAHVAAYAAPAVQVYGELLFSDVFTFPAFDQGSLQVRQAYALFGDLSVSPFYFYLGKKNIGFGSFETLSPFTQAVPWHYFAALSEGIGAGYIDDQWNMTIAAINGGRGIRVNDSTEQGKLNNLAADINWSIGEAEDARFVVGGSFLLGTIYDGFTAEHLDTNQFGTEYNSAWDVYSRLDFGSISVSGEFASTTRSWPVTNSRVNAYRVEAAYWLTRRLPDFFSVSWSSGRQGPSGSQFELNEQLVLGYQRTINENFRLAAEYVRSMGFAPLINIATVSDRDVVQDSVVLGATIIL